MTGVIEGLRSAQGSIRHNAVKALDFPWAWPGAGSEQWSTAKSFKSQVPILRPGQVLLASVTGLRSDLWSFELDGTPPPQSTALSSAMQHLFHQGSRLALRDFEGWAVLRNQRPSHLFVRHIGAVGAGHPSRILDGDSFGLALASAALSRGLGQPVSPEVAALAAVDSAGRLRPVDGLERKLAAIRAWAPVITRVIVEETQIDEALRHAWSGLEVVGATRIAAALRLCMNLDELRVLADSTQAADDLFHVAVANDEPVASWNSVRNAVETVMQRAGISEAARWKLSCAKAIVRRHSGDPVIVPGAPPPEVDLILLYREGLEAHRLQGLTDAGHDELPAVIEATLSTIPRAWDCTPEGLKLRGALGRALARIGRYRDAAAILEDTISAWFEMRRPEGASYALCEWARIAGVIGEHEMLTRATTEIERLRSDVHLDHVSEAFLRLAMLRAWVQCHRAPGAREWLMDFDWTRTPVWVAASKDRWLARLLILEERCAEAAELRLAVRSHGEPELAELKVLVQIDECLENNRDARDLLAQYRALPASRESRWLLEGLTAAEQLQRIFNESSY